MSIWLALYSINCIISPLLQIPFPNLFLVIYNHFFFVFRITSWPWPDLSNSRRSLVFYPVDGASFSDSFFATPLYSYKHSVCKTREYLRIEVFIYYCTEHIDGKWGQYRALRVRFVIKMADFQYFRKCTSKIKNKSYNVQFFVCLSHG